MLLPALERIANAALNADADTKARLATLNGKVARVTLTGPPFTLYLLPTVDGLRLLADYDGTPDVALVGPLAAFLRLATGDDAAAPFRENQIAIDGDLELGHKLHRIFKDLRIDWEEQVARIFGDVLARQLGNVVRGFAGWSQSTVDLLARDAGEYLQYERALLPDANAVAEFVRAVDRLRLDADRLAARVALLEARA